jgi:hypothetical protein
VSAHRVHTSCMTIFEEFEHKKHLIATLEKDARGQRLLAERQANAPDQRQQTLELAESFEKNAELLRKQLQEFEQRHGLTS